MVTERGKQIFLGRKFQSFVFMTEKALFRVATCLSSEDGGTQTNPPKMTLVVIRQCPSGMLLLNYLQL